MFATDHFSMSGELFPLTHVKFFLEVFDCFKLTVLDLTILKTTRARDEWHVTIVVIFVQPKVHLASMKQEGGNCYLAHIFASTVKLSNIFNVRFAFLPNSHRSAK